MFVRIKGILFSLPKMVLRTYVLIIDIIDIQVLNI